MSLIAGKLDLEYLVPNPRKTDLEALCSRAICLGLRSVCVPSSAVTWAAHWLEDSDVQVCCAVGWPFGVADGDAKRYEAELAIDLGANEIDLVLDAGLLLDRDEARVIREIRDVIEGADEHVVKLMIPEACLERSDIVLACQWAVEAQAHFVGLLADIEGGTNLVEMAALLRETVGQSAGVKLSGGAAALATADEVLEAGATRIGASTLEGLAELDDEDDDDAALAE